MEPFVKVTGALAPLPLDNINTDQICPTSAHGFNSTYGDYLFHTQRFRPDGSEIAEFVLNRPAFREARLLLAGDHFGCGSGRESAVWALAGAGIRCVIALSFADIFRENCLRNGVLPLALPAERHGELLAAAEAAEGAPFTVDLDRQVIVLPSGGEMPFDVSPAEREALLNGLDDIGLSLRHLSDIEDWERRTAADRPWLQRT